MNVQKITLNLFDIFRLGYLRGIEPNTNICELLPILGEPVEIQELRPLIDINDGSKIICESYYYPNIEFSVYNGIIEHIYIILIGNSRTKGLKLIGYNKFRKITRKKLRNYILKNGGTIIQDRSYFKPAWFISYKIKEKGVWTYLRRGQKDYIQSFNYQCLD